MPIANLFRRNWYSPDPDQRLPIHELPDVRIETAKLALHIKKSLRIFNNGARVEFEIRLQRFAERHGLCRDHMHERSALKTGKHGGVDFLSELRVLRKRLADERDVPAYVVFSDATLRAMARRRPKSLTELRGVSGVGDKKLTDFGAAFLETLGSFADRAL